jgi:hypothetical protein
MKWIHWVYSLMIISFILTGCEPSSPTIRPTLSDQNLTPTFVTGISTPKSSITQIPINTVSRTPSPTIALSTSTPLPSMTPMVVDTLEAEKANETIKNLLIEPIDCSAPCFWGIAPGQTTLDKANQTFNHLGLQMMSSTVGGKDFSATGYNLDNGLSFRVILTTNNNIVENLRIKIDTEKKKAGIARAWSAYSPETLIKRYGMPSRVDFFADWGPGPFFSMQMYFDKHDLIVQYSGEEVIPAQRGSVEVCPLTVQFEAVWLWMGKDPINPPGQGVPLDKVTSLAIEDFSRLMTGDPNQACFIFKGNDYP